MPNHLFHRMAAPQRHSAIREVSGRHQWADRWLQMGYNYYIACKRCQRFLDLGRWRVFHDLQFPEASKELFPGAGNVAAAPVDGPRLRERLRIMDDPFSVNHKGEADFQKLAAILAEFCDKHDSHELYLINDSGDFPWSACDRYPWYEWAEVFGPNTDMGGVDLPKNLIHDLHEIEKHLLRSHRYDPATFPGDIDLVKHGFEVVRKSTSRWGG